MTPPGDRWPEGPRDLDFLRWYGDLIGREVRVVEFGCGDGRLCRAFRPDYYLGLDICGDAVSAAVVHNAGYLFACIKPRQGVSDPGRDVAFAHTVLLHVPDDEISATVEYLCKWAPRVVISEMLGRSWRRDGDPPVFNRDQRDYEALFDNCGFTLCDTHTLPVPRYDNAPMTFMDFRRG